MIKNFVSLGFYLHGYRDRVYSRSCSWIYTFHRATGTNHYISGRWGPDLVAGYTPSIELQGLITTFQVGGGEGGPDL